MVSDTQRELLGYVARATMEAFPDHVERLVTTNIANSLHVSRNLASQYLNELVRAGLVVKVGSRPVYYLHRKTLEQMADVRLEQSSFADLDAVQVALGNRVQKDFQTAIGANLSLSGCISQCKAAIQYPPFGLPLLLKGEAGSGKRHLARLAFEYGKNEGIIPKSGRFVEIDCRNEKQLEGVLSSHQRLETWQHALLTPGQGGVIYLSHADQLDDHMLSLVCSAVGLGQEEQGLKDGLAKISRIILSTEKAARDERVQAVERCAPLVASVPTFHNRTYQEREELIALFLKRQAHHMAMKIFISRGAFSCLTEATFADNIDGLQGCITNCCAQAYLNRSDEQLVIRAYQLPPAIIRPAAESQPGDEELLDAALCAIGQDDEYLIQLLEALIDAFNEVDGAIEQDDVDLRGIEMRVRDVQDHIMFERRISTQHIDTYERIINEIFDDARERFGFDISAKSGHLLAQEIFIQIRSGARLSDWMSFEEDRLANLHAQLARHFRVPGAVEQLVAFELRRVLGFDLAPLVRVLLLLDISMSATGLTEQSALGIVLSHGYSTATSIADAANRILHAHVFEGIDMYYDQQVSDIVVSLRQIIERYPCCSGVILLVDMGSLEQIDREIEDIAACDVGLINNASTGLAVEIGAGILDNRSIEDILAHAAGECSCRWRIASSLQRESAVVFCSEISIDAADKIRTLIDNSLPSEIPLHFVTRSYQQLEKNGRRDTVFERYDVEAVIGTMNPGVQPHTFIALEDVISKVGIDRLDAVFAAYLTKEELEVFHHRLVKNMTLRSVIESLTILNPEKLYADVEDAVTSLQRHLATVFDSRLMIGLYIHLCCLIERLVTKTPIEVYVDEEAFLRSHEAFVSAFRKSFQNIAQRYKVEVPTCEITYVHDYIHSCHDSGSTSAVVEGGVALENE